jgi:hypothetical protein
MPSKSARSQSRNRNAHPERSNRSVGNRYNTPLGGRDLRPKLDANQRNQDARTMLNTNRAKHYVTNPWVLITDYRAFAPNLRRVVWPLKFKPGPIKKYDGATNPREWIQIYSIVIEAAYGDDYVKANHPRLSCRVQPEHGWWIYSKVPFSPGLIYVRCLRPTAIQHTPIPVRRMICLHVSRIPMNLLGISFDGLVMSTTRSPTWLKIGWS